MLQMKKTALGVALVLVALIAAILFGDYYLRCHGKPLSREEALQRATAKLQRFSQDFVIGDPLPALVEEKYEADEKVWMFTFHNSTCTIDILADRCHGTDIGGTTGCKVRLHEK